MCSATITWLVAAQDEQTGASDHCCKQMTWCVNKLEAFFSPLSSTSSAEPSRWYHQASSILATVSRALDHMLLQTRCMCVKVCVYVCALSRCVATSNTNSPIHVRKAFFALYKALIRTSAWRRLRNHLVSLKTHIFYSFIHTVLLSWSRWSKSQEETGWVLLGWCSQVTAATQAQAPTFSAFQYIQSLECARIQQSELAWERASYTFIPRLSVPQCCIATPILADFFFFCKVSHKHANATILVLQGGNW